MSTLRLRTVFGLVRLLGPYLAFGVLRHVIRLDSLARWAWRPAVRRRDPQREGLAVARVAKLGHLFPYFDHNCLQRSLVLYREFSRGGSSPSLVIGFRRTSTGVDGHAWVEVDGLPVGETEDVQAVFARTCAFGARGERA